MATKRDSQNVLRNDEGVQGAGQYAAEQLGENTAESLARASSGRSKLLPSEILSNASELDLERLETVRGLKPGVSYRNRTGLEEFERAFSALEAYEQKHGTWKFEETPEWMQSSIESLMVDPTVDVPRHNDTSIELRDGTAVVGLCGRFGGGNRDCCCRRGEEGSCTGCLADALSGYDGYISDEDSVGDYTYATAYFTIADEEKRAEATRILTANNLADAAANRDNLIAGAPIWTLGAKPRDGYPRKNLADFNALEDARARSVEAQRMLDHLNAGALPDVEEAKKLTAGTSFSGFDGLDFTLGGLAGSQESLEAEQAKSAELLAPLDAGILTGEPERVIRESLERSNKSAEIHIGQREKYLQKVRASLAQMAKPVEIGKHLQQFTKADVHVQLWGFDRQRPPAEFRETEYFQQAMTERMRRSPGFDKLDETAQAEVIAWAMKP